VTRVSLLPLVAVVVVAALAAAPASWALDCRNIPLSEKLQDADQAFVGKVVSERPLGGNPARWSYRFTVEQKLKGEFGAAVDIRAARLVDASDVPIMKHRADSIGVLVMLDGAIPTTDSCDLSSPAALISAFDEPRGNGIRVVVGILLLLLVLGYSSVRLKRKQRSSDAPSV
jgi:hypothetical protein